MRRLALAVALLMMSAAGVAQTGASFTAGTKSNPGNAVAAARIFPADRLQSAWSLSDAVSGSAADLSDPLAFADGRLDTTSNTQSTFSSSRYLDLDYDNAIPAGLTPQAVTFNFDFSDDNGDAKTTCFYFEVRRASTNAVLGTFGSSGAPVACEPSTSIQETSTSIASAVPTTDVANDLRVRVFATDQGNNGWEVDRATVSVKVYGKTYTAFAQQETDVLDGSAATTAWGPAKTDGTGFQSATNWPTAFAATKFIELTFPSNVPGSASLSAVTLEHQYSSSVAGSNACVYIEVYSGGTLIGSHGSSASPYSCNSTTTARSDSIPLPEVDTPGEANGLTIRIYGRSSGSDKTNHDLVALRENYSLGATGCTDAGTVTVDATRDSWADQNAPTSTTGGTATTVNVKTLTGSKNRRAFAYFPLPSLGDGCTLQSATLRLYQTTAAGTRTIEVLRAGSSWSESTLNWNNQPAATGTPVGVVANSANAWVSWNVGTLASQLYSSGNFGFVLRDSAEGAATAAENKFQSREAGANTPQLVLTIG